MKSTKRVRRSIYDRISNSSSPSSDGTTNLSSFRRKLIDLNLQFPAIIRLAFALFLFLFWRFRFGDFLYMAQEYDLFLWNYAFFADASLRIAGLSRYLSSFFIQFFYFPTLGATILVGFLIYIQYATEKLFRLRGWTSVFSYLPACLLTIQITNARYLFFENRDVAYLFSFTFNLAFALLFASLFNAMRSPKLRAAFLTITTFLTYPVFGFFTLFGAVLCVIIETTLPVENHNDASIGQVSASKDSKARRRERCELLVLFVLAVPAFFYFLIYADTTPSLQYAYVAGVSEESIVSAEVEPYTNVIYQFYIKDFYLILCALYYAIAICVAFIFRKPDVVSDVPKNVSKYQAISYVLMGVLTSIFCVATFRCSFITEEYRALLKTARALDRQDWNRMIECEARVPIPNEASITARYLALTRSGRIAEELFTRPTTPALKPELSSVPAFFVMGDRILFEYGLFNLAERTASNNLVPKQDRSFWSSKTLALCAIANDQRALALRVLWGLKDALFHRRWALELIDYVLAKDSTASVYDRFVTTSGTSKERIGEIDARFQETKRQEPFDDGFSPTYSVDNMRFSLINEEDVSRRDLDDFEARLVVFLVMREYSRFATFFDKYIAVKGKERLPRYFQEAALLREKYPALFGEESWKTPEGVVIDPEIRARFDEFIRLFLLTKTDQSAKEKIKREFADTFWRSTML